MMKKKKMSYQIFFNHLLLLILYITSSSVNCLPTIFSSKHSSRGKSDVISNVERKPRRVQACGNSTSNGVGNRPFSERDLLRGFKINIVEGEDAFKRPIFKGEIETDLTPVEYTCQSHSNSTQEATYIIDVKGSAGVSFGPLARASGSLSYLKEKVSVKKQVTFMYRSRYVAFSKVVNTTTLQPVSNDIYDLDADEITDLYGTKFVKGISYGAQLEIFYSFTSSEEIDIRHINGRLNFRIGPCPFCAKFSVNFEKFEGLPPRSDMSVNVDIRIIGLDLIPPPNPTYDETMDLIRGFNQKYINTYEERGTSNFENRNIANKFGPIAFSLGSIVDHLPGKITYEEVNILDARMERMGDVMLTSLLLISQLVQTRNAQEAFYESDPKGLIEIFEPYKLVVDTVVNNLHAKVDECLEFRRLPFSTIVGKNGIEKVPLPEKYPQNVASSLAYNNTVNDRDILNGLLGKVYLPSPVTVGNTKFRDIYYVGFAIPTRDDDGNIIMTPWMSGVMRKDDDSKTHVANSTYSSGELEKKAYAAINEIEETSGFDFVRYGDQHVYLQSNSRDSLWLAPAPEDNGTGVVTNENVVEGQGSWILQSRPYDTNGELNDPKYGQCLKYGDTIYLRDVYSADLLSDCLGQEEGLGNQTNVTFYDETKGWLSRTGNGLVALQQLLDAKNSNSELLDWHARWIVRGESPLRERQRGQCVHVLSKIYLQNFEDQRLVFLEGSNSSSKEVSTSSNLTKETQWILRDFAGNGNRTDGFSCGAVKAMGKWVHLTAVDKGTVGHVKYVVGIVDRKGVPSNWQHTPSWEQSILSSVSRGFNVLAERKLSSDTLASDTKHKVDSFYGSILVKGIVDVGDIFKTKKNLRYPLPFGHQAWQFEFNIEDLCVESWRLNIDAIVVTASNDDMPCCLPGFELDSGVPHGPCRISSPCFCDKSICASDTPLIYVPESPTAPPYPQVPSSNQISPIGSNKYFSGWTSSAILVPTSLTLWLSQLL